jgi:hypothetical protein
MIRTSTGVLESAYLSAEKKGLIRGSKDYFEYLERGTGIRKDDAPVNDDDERELSVQAPVTRSERGTDGRVPSGKIMLNPEEREICRSMGISEIDYARQKVAMAADRKENPEKYFSPR